MTHGSIADRAIKLIKARGRMRTSELAKALSVPATSIGSSLKWHSENGTLITCKVAIPGSKDQIEYRLSASGSPTNHFTVLDSQRTPPRPPRPDEIKPRPEGGHDASKRTNEPAAGGVKEAPAANGIRFAFLRGGTFVIVGAEEGSLLLTVPEARALREYFASPAMRGSA
jgi:hypothetical protein